MVTTDRYLCVCLCVENTDEITNTGDYVRGRNILFRKTLCMSIGKRSISARGIEMSLYFLDISSFHTGREIQKCEQMNPARLARDTSNLIIVTFHRPFHFPLSAFPMSNTFSQDVLQIELLYIPGTRCKTGFSTRLHPDAIDAPFHRSRRFRRNFTDTTKQIRNPG